MMKYLILNPSKDCIVDRLHFSNSFLIDSNFLICIFFAVCLGKNRI